MLVALALGMALVLAGSGVLLASRKTTALEDAAARLQETGRIALDLLRADLERAGYLGCNTGEVLFVDMLENRAAPGSPTPLHALRGYARRGSGAWSDHPPAARELHGARALASPGSGGARPGSDVLKLRTGRRLVGPGPGGGLLRVPVAPGADRVSLFANPECALRRHARVVITACGPSAHRFAVSNAPACGGTGSVELVAGPPNVIDAIHAPYGLDADVILAEEVVWFVGDTGRERDGRTVWGLYREVIGDGRGAQEVAEGVEHMQVQFRTRLAGSGATRIGGPEAAFEPTPARVDAVAVGLLVQGFARIDGVDDRRSYTVLDERVVPAGSTASGQGAVHSSGPVPRDVFTVSVATRNASAG